MDNLEKTGLYCVVDRISNHAFTGIIPAANDLVAVFGFLNWLKKQTDVDSKCYKLCHCGEWNSDGQILGKDFYDVVTGDKAQEFYDNEVVKALEVEES